MLPFTRYLKELVFVFMYPLPYSFSIAVVDDVAGGMEEEGEEYEIDEEKEAYYKDDPKKALKKFFDREGLEFEYEVEEEGTPKDRVYTVRVR